MPSPLSALSRKGRSRRLTGAGALGVLGVTALLVSACSSTPSNNGATNNGANNSSGATVASLEKWPTTPIALQETGSSLEYPVWNLWAAQIHTEWPAVSITTAATGSGTGISDAANGTVNIGASDAYLSQAQLTTTPGLENIPLAVSGQQVNYNVPGLAGHLKLNGAVLAGMYQGQITNWNDAKIAALNPGVALPNLAIVPIHRSDSSGDTFLFSSFLTDADPMGWTLAPGTTVAWPAVTGAVTAQGNGGMVQACKANAGCVAYIGVSYLNQATAAGLGYAALQNKSGNFELPTQAAIGAEAAGFGTVPASGTLSMIFGSAAQGYPIANFEYAIVQKKQASALAAQAVKASLAWVIDPSGGNAPSFLDQVGFVVLSAQAEQVSVNLIAKITS